MSYYDSLDQEVVDLHYLTREHARLIVIQKIRDCHSRCIPCVKFITGRGNHINATGERGALYEEFPSWMLDSEIERLVQDYDPCNGYYLVYLDLLAHAPSFKQLCALLSFLVLLLLIFTYILYILVVTYSTLSSMSDYLDYKITYSNNYDSY
ncbi:unnamed protein product [Rhizophagus irregularis]|uniref:Smr domain-containing protein n=1 Tax=Rhizophagus irregularis TaxID=588596 RepID=A0A2I1GQH8_9GLOM|nr:hypothetical protein RhiirA4_526310 [Rhizophagus irregularis]CAB4418484.1 unnamed protein product [Rhizophagus irregularis]